MQQTESSTWNSRGVYSFPDLLTELERRKASSFDLVVPAEQMRISPVDNGFHLSLSDGEELHKDLTEERKQNPHITQSLLESSRISPDALQQVGQRMDPPVPWKFLKGLGAQLPKTAASMLNDLLQDSGKQNMARFQDGNLRAYLSSRYRVMDHYDAAFSAATVIRENEGKVLDCRLTDRVMNLRFTTSEVFDQLKAAQDQGKNGIGVMGNQQLGRYGGWWDNPDYVMPHGPDTVFPLITVSNSETGHGGYTVKSGLIQGCCFNGCIVETVLAKTHLGGEVGSGVYTPQTTRAMAQAVHLQTRDCIASMFDQKHFTELINRVRESQGVEIPKAKTELALDAVISQTEMLEGMKTDLLTYFVRDYQPTAYGVAQAVSRLAQDVDAEKAVSLEEIAGQIMLSPKMVAV